MPSGRPPRLPAGAVSHVKSAGTGVIRTEPPRNGRPALPFRGLPPLARTFGIDVRSLAALRVGLAILILADLALRAPYLKAHYSDEGIMPREGVHSLISVYLLGGSAAWAGLLFAVAAVFAGMLLIGYRTRLATLASWYLLISLHLRNPLVLHAGDKLMALLLFWGMFLPLGRVGSVDSRARQPHGPPVVVSAATLALLLQVAFVYMFSAILKDERLWLLEGSALYYALEIDLVTTDIGRSLLDFPTLLRLLSRGTFLLELFVGLLAFVPLRTARFRTAVVAVMIGFHLALAMCLHLGLFSYVCIVAWLAFLPTELWEALGRSAVGSGLRRAGNELLEQVSSPIRLLPRRVRGLTPKRVGFGSPPVVNAVAGLLLVYVFLWNVGTVSSLAMPSALRRLGEELCLRQHWYMFASPLRADGWWIVPARLRDGSEVDLQTGASPVRWEKPNSVWATYGTSRTMKWLTEVWWPEHRPRIADYAAWLRRDWDRRHSPARRVESLQVYFILEETQPQGQRPHRADLLVHEWSGAGDQRTVSYEENLRSIPAMGHESQ